MWRSGDGKNWTKVTDNAGWTPRIGHGTAVYDNKLWIIGGCNESSGFEKDVWCSEDGKTWTCVTNNAPFGNRSNAAAIVYDNKLWLLGGASGSSSTCNDVWSSTDGKNWTAVTAAPWPKRSHHTAFIYGNELWIAGGDGGSACLNDVWRSKDGKTWTKAPDAPWSKRRGFPAAIFKNKLWISGGYDKSSYMNDIWYCDEPISGLVSDDNRPNGSMPVELRMIHSPFSGGAAFIEYTMPRPATARISIFDFSGRELRVLVNETKSAGTYCIPWNGSSADGSALSGGAYIIRMKTSAGSITLTRKVME